MRFIPIFEQDHRELQQQGETHEQYEAYREYVANLEQHVSDFALQEGPRGIGNHRLTGNSSIFASIFEVSVDFLGRFRFRGLILVMGAAFWASCKQLSSRTRRLAPVFGLRNRTFRLEKP